MSSSKVILICLSFAVLLAATSANECAEVAHDYVMDYNRRYGKANRLDEVSSCVRVGSDPDVFRMSLIMRDYKDNFTSCLDITVEDGRVVDWGTCY